MKTRVMVLRIAACVLALTVLMGMAYPAEAGFWGPATRIILRGGKIILPYGEHVICVVEKVGKNIIRIIVIKPVTFP